MKKVGSIHAGRLAALVPLTLLILLFVWQIRVYYIPAFYGLSDEHIYMLLAKTIATRGTVADRTAGPFAASGEAQWESSPGVYYPIPPIGYSLLGAVAYKIGGPDAPFLVNPICGVLSLIALFFLAEAMAPPRWKNLSGLLAAGVFAVHPLMVLYSLRSLSHMPDICISCWAMLAAGIYSKRGNPWSAALAGLLTGLVIWIRLTQVLLVLPLAWALYWRWQQQQSAIQATAASSHFSLRRIRGPLFALAGMLLPILGLLIYQWQIYGSPFVTGYARIGRQNSFGLHWFFAHIGMVLHVLLAPGTGLNLLLPLALIALAAGWKRDRFHSIFLALWAIPGLLLYTAYTETHGQNLILYARFFVAIYPPLILAAILLLAWILDWIQNRVPSNSPLGAGAPALPESRRIPKKSAATPLATVSQRTLSSAAKLSVLIAIVLVIAAATWNFDDQPTADALLEQQDTCKFAREMARIARNNFPPGAIMIAGKDLHYYFDYSCGFVLYSPHLFDAADVQRRLADQTKTPRQFDPVRTAEIAQLVGHKPQEQLDAQLRGVILQRLNEGRTVGIIDVADAQADWQRRLGDLKLHPVAEALNCFAARIEK